MKSQASESASNNAAKTSSNDELSHFIAMNSQIRDQLDALEEEKTREVANDNDSGSKIFLVRNALEEVRKRDLQNLVESKLSRQATENGWIHLIEAKDGEIAELKEKLEASKEYSEMEIYTLEKSIKDLNEKNVDIRQNNTELQKTISDLVNSHEIELQLLNNQLKDLLAEKAQMDAQVKWLHGHVKDLTEQLAVFKK